MSLAVLRHTKTVYLVGLIILGGINVRQLKNILTSIESN